MTPTDSVPLLPSTHMGACHQMNDCREDQKDILYHNPAKFQGPSTGKTLSELLVARIPLIYVR